MIDEIDCCELPKERIRIAVCQLELRSEQIAFPPRHLSASALTRLRARVQRILSELKEYQPDVVQFPECAIPEKLVPELKIWSQEHNSIIIAGTHYAADGNNFISKCPVIFPSGDIYSSEKITISPLEKRPAPGAKIVPGTIRYLFRNSVIGNFLVLICSDFLDSSTISSIATLQPDLLFVSAFHRGPNRYHPALSDLCVNSNSGIYCTYSNVLCQNSADGKSAIFAVTDNAYLSAYVEAGITDLKPQQKLWEAASPNDYVVAALDLHMKKAVIPKSANAGPNVEIITTRSIVERRERLDKSKRRYRLIAFDMDGTLIRGIKFSWVQLWEMCGDDGTLWQKYLQKFLKGTRSQEEYDEWCNIAARYYKEARLTKDLIADVARQSGRLTDNFRSGMEILRKTGFKTAIVSGGVDIFLRTLIPDYQNLFDYSYVNKLYFDADDVVSGVEPTKFDYLGKAEALRLMCDECGFDLSETIYVGDRFNDLEAIRIAGHSIIYSDERDGVHHAADHRIFEDNFGLLVEYVLSITELDEKNRLIK